MNEQFRKLLSRATELADEVFDYDGSDYAEIVQKKFAELIVKECFRVAVQKEDGDTSDYNSGRSWAGIDILKHFGVEE
jgi:hypothetical protein